MTKIMAEREEDKARMRGSAGSLPSAPTSAPTRGHLGSPKRGFSSVQFSSVQLLSRVRLFATPWTAARQASLSVTNSRSPPKLMSIESVMPFSHLILCRPLLLLGFSLSQRGFARVQTRPHLFQEFPGYPVQCWVSLTCSGNSLRTNQSPRRADRALSY